MKTWWLAAWLGFGDRDEEYNMMVAGKSTESEEREVWCVEGAREAFSWWLLKRKVGSDAEKDSKVCLGCWKAQGSLRSSLGGFGNRVMAMTHISGNLGSW